MVTRTLVFRLQATQGETLAWRRIQKGDVPNRFCEAFPARLATLFETARTPSGEQWTNTGLAIACTSDGVPVVQSYISQLRHGKRDNPSAALVQAIAKAVGISPMYFFDGTCRPKKSQPTGNGGRDRACLRLFLGRAPWRRRRPAPRRRGRVAPLHRRRHSGRAARRIRTAGSSRLAPVETVVGGLLLFILVQAGEVEGHGAQIEGLAGDGGLGRIRPTAAKPR